MSSKIYIVGRIESSKYKVSRSGSNVSVMVCKKIMTSTVLCHVAGREKFLDSSNFCQRRLFFC